MHPTPRPNRRGTPKVNSSPQRRNPLRRESDRMGASMQYSGNEYGNLTVKCSCGAVLNVSDLVADGEADWEEQTPAPFVSTTFRCNCPKCDAGFEIVINEAPIDVEITNYETNRTERLQCGTIAHVKNMRKKPIKKKSLPKRDSKGRFVKAKTSTKKGTKAAPKKTVKKK